MTDLLADSVWPVVLATAAMLVIALVAAYLPEAEPREWSRSRRCGNELAVVVRVMAITALRPAAGQWTAADVAAHEVERIAIGEKDS